MLALREYDDGDDSDDDAALRGGPPPLKKTNSPGASFMRGMGSMGLGDGGSQRSEPYLTDSQLDAALCDYEVEETRTIE